MTLRKTLTLFAILLGLSVSPPTQARSLSQEDVLSADFVSGWSTAKSQIAGLELHLAPEWKTYWRSPGEAGIPPQFDWSASQNLASIKVLWPKPSVFLTNGMQTLGYKGHVILPLEVKAIDPNLPVFLSLDMELGVCKDVCLPAFITLAQKLAPQGKPRPPLEAALRSLPAASSAKISCKIEPIADGLRLTTSVTLPSLGRQEIVAIEPMDRRIWVSEPESQRQGDRLTTVAELVAPSGAPFALERSSLTFTLIGQSRSLEIKGCTAP